ncbi:exopolysaccharide biosynthesis protein [Roseivirga sp.]|uniref:exopolysaccharide biosynthesis protein n=1 Tax=Roseivirga sp. TaxID=1964215 RepID=UPI003B8B8CBB
MSVQDNHMINEEKLNLASVIINVRQWVLGLLLSWKIVLLGSMLSGAVFLAYKSLKPTVYTAETSFVLETDNGSGIGGQLSSLASLAGVNVGALTESSSLFQLDNIIELYRSYRMLKKTLLTRSDGSNGERLITRFGRESKQLNDWLEEDVDFEIANNQMVVKHDSILKEVTELILENHLSVGKPNRKLSILNVSYRSKDALFSKDFNEILVEHVNRFYKETRTKKTGENLKILGIQADSVKKVLDNSLMLLANFQEENPNLNPLSLSARVPMQKLQIDVQASGTVYQEVVKNLEIAKIAHRNNQPLIQTIDSPVLPLEDDKMKWYKALIIGLLVGGFLSVIFVSTKRIYYSITKDIP